MILTLTLNPAIDRTISVDRLGFEDRGYVNGQRDSAGGRGINASTVLHSFGAATMAIVPAGGSSRAHFEQLVAAYGYPHDVVPIEQGVRTNMVITDQRGLAVKINERGPAVSEAELARIEAAVIARLANADWLLLCGSLPPGTSPAIYRRLIRAARDRKVKTLLDTDGPALQDCLLEEPTCVTPNLQEASLLLNKPLITRQRIRTAAQRILGMGARSVVLTQGGRGAIAARDAEVFEVVPPRVESPCSIGAGDALNAALVWALSRNHDFVDAARWGVAAGTASAMLPGMRFATLAETGEIHARVEVR